MKSKKSSPFKISCPELKKVFPRKQLFSQLSESLNFPIIWISGPPGSGKTTLLSSFVQKSNVKYIWYRLDSSDSDPPHFFSNFKRATKSVLSESFNKFPRLTPEYLNDILSFAREFFSNLFINVKSPFHVVFDDYHEVYPRSIFHEVMRVGLEQIPDGVNFFIISRLDPPAPFSRLRANNLVHFIGWNHLRLTQTESSGIIKNHFKQHYSRKFCEEIYRLSSGWAAGLILLLESVKRDALLQESTIQFEATFDYFDYELMRTSSEETKEFLLKTSVFNEMSASMADNLLDFKGSEKIFSRMFKTNFFTEMSSHPNPAYRYHPLFHEYVKRKAKVAYKEVEIKKLQKKAAGILGEEGRIEEAIHLYKEISDANGILLLLEKHGEAYINQGRNQLIENWINAMPESLRKSSPRLDYLLGLSLLHNDFEQSQFHFEQAYRLFLDKKEFRGAALACSGIIDSLAAGERVLFQLDRWVPVLEKLLHDFPDQFSAETFAKLTTSIYLGLSHRRGNLSGYDAWEEKAVGLARESDDLSVKSQIFFTYAQNKIREGDLPEAFLAIESFRKLSKFEEVSPKIKIMGKYLEASYFMATASFLEVIQTVEEGLEFSSEEGIPIYDLWLLGFATLSAIAANDLQKAAGFLERSSRLMVSQNVRAHSFYYYLQGLLALHRGDIRASFSSAKIALKHAESVGMPFMTSLINILLAHVNVELKNHKKATYHINQSIKIGGKGHFRQLEFGCSLTEAYIHFQLGETQEMLLALHRGLSLGSESGYCVIFGMNQKMVSELFSFALEHHIETEYVHELIKKHNIVPEKDPIDLLGWPWPIKIFTLGRFVILKKGKALLFSKKAPQGPLSLLKTLIALGGRDVSEDQITEVLWPDADGDSAHRVLAINLHRLRSLLGTEKAIVLSNGRLTLNGRICQVDSWAFERSIGKSNSALKDGKEEEASCFLEKALKMYQGPFLAHDILPPISILRERLRSKCLKQISLMGRYFMEKGRYQISIEVLKKGIEMDPLAEEFYQHLMTCYQNLGFKSEGLRVYADLKRILQANLGVPPSPQSEMIYKNFLI